MSVVRMEAPVLVSVGNGGGGDRWAGRRGRRLGSSFDRPVPAPQPRRSGATGHNRAVRLTSFEPANLWDPPSVTLMGRVAVGNRRDLAWAECHPPLRIGDRAYELVLLQSRDRNESLWSVDGGPVHVYVCTTPDDSMARDQVPR